MIVNVNDISPIRIMSSYPVSIDSFVSGTTISRTRLRYNPVLCDVYSCSLKGNDFSF